MTAIGAAVVEPLAAGRRGRRARTRRRAGRRSSRAAPCPTPAMPQACGRGALAGPGGCPTHGACGSGALELSHHDQGPLWPCGDHELEVEDPLVPVAARRWPGRPSPWRRCSRSSSSRRGSRPWCPAGGCLAAGRSRSRRWRRSCVAPGPLTGAPRRRASQAQPPKPNGEVQFASFGLLQRLAVFGCESEHGR